MDDDRPVIRCFVACPLNERWLTGAALVPLEVAADLQQRGWLVIGPDPEDEQKLAHYELARPWLRRFTTDT